MPVPAVLGDEWFVVGRALLILVVTAAGFLLFPAGAWADAQVHVQLDGNGSVAWSVDPPGPPGRYTCPPSCDFDYPSGGVATFVAAPGPDRSFAGWTGCTNASDSTCTVNVLFVPDFYDPILHQWWPNTVHYYVVAHFAIPLRTIHVTRTGAGAGVVTSSPPSISCGGDCLAGFADGTEVTLRAVPADGSVFVGWDAPCVAGTDPAACTIVANRDVEVGARFVPVHAVSIVRVGTGAGSLTSVSGGISCGDDCAEQVVDGSTLEIVAVPDAGSVFGGWAGACSGRSTSCRLTVHADTTIEARFALKPRLTALRLLLTPPSPRAGTSLTAKLYFRTQGEPSSRQPAVRCTAAAGSVSLRLQQRRSDGRTATCTWRLPTAAAGALVRGSVQVVWQGLTTQRRFSIRVKP